MKYQIKPKQALACVAKKDKVKVQVQTKRIFKQELWDKSRFKQIFKNAEKIKINSGLERFHGYGIEVLAPDGEVNYDYLFVEHDEEALSRLEKALGGEPNAV